MTYSPEPSESLARKLMIPRAYLAELVSCTDGPSPMEQEIRNYAAKLT